MESFPAKAYLAQVFDDRVKDSITRIAKLCEALDVTPVWIDGASSAPPADEAKDKIADSDFLIAFCTRKDKLDGCDAYHTSNAVREEIAIAKAMDKQVLCFLEKGVKADGFSGSRSTYSILENAESLTAKDLLDITRGIHRTKLKSIKSAPEVVHATGINNYIIQDFIMEVELVDDKLHGLYWAYTTERLFVFDADHDQPLTHSAFCLEGTHTADKPLYKLDFYKNGARAIPELDVREFNNGVNIRSRLKPQPAKGDQVFVREYYRSPYLNPIFDEQDLGIKLNIDSHTLSAYDGICVISRVKNLSIRYKFPREYVVKDLQPVVATFSNQLDNVNMGEVERIVSEKSFTVRNFNETTTAEISIQRPLYQYFYGLGWNVPSRGGLGWKIADAPPPFET
ncbi:MAG: hypothetical protein U1D69_15440 [Polynucleobacter sp.]|nr:hypothetical protein [Polynucleobacter sp.]